MNKKWLQKSACILLTVCMVQGFTSCNKNPDASSIVESIMVTDVLKIYRLYSNSAMRFAVKDFKERYFTTVEETVIKDPAEFSIRMNTELMAGQGPDVIIADPSIFNSFHKTMSSGVFYDINSFMENDNNFIPSEYNKTVLDSGIVEGKRLYIPLVYKVPCIWTVKSISDDSGLSSIIDNWTWQQLLDIGKSFVENSQSGKKRYIFSDDYSAKASHGFEGYAKIHYDAFQGLLQSSGMEFVDYEKKQSHFNSSQFISLLETLKELNDRSTPDDVLTSYKSGYYDQIKEKSLMAVCDDTGSILTTGELSYINSWTQNLTNEDPVLYTFPTYGEGNKVIAESLEIAAINSNSKNKKAAYDFIKIVLKRGGSIDGIPIDKAAAETRNPFLNPQPAPLLLEQAKKITNNIGGCSIMDQGVRTFVQESVESFIKGDITAKQAAEMIDNKVMLFLSE